MNAASQPLCAELYELSNWEMSEFSEDWYTRTKVSEGPMFIAPRYMKTD